MKIFEKLLEIQKSVDAFVKDGTNTSDRYSYVSSDAVLGVIRPKMNELQLLLIPSTKEGRVHEGTTKSGTTRYLTEIDKEFVWVDCETGETYSIPFYAQGVDLAGEKGVGKAETYAEKYFLMKLFHVPTSKDDPDSDGKTGSGEKKQHGTQAAKENQDYMRKALQQILTTLYGTDAEKIKATIVLNTKNDARQYAGVDSIDAISSAALPVVYSKIKSAYEKRTGQAFVYKEDSDAQ